MGYGRVCRKNGWNVEKNVDGCNVKEFVKRVEYGFGITGKCGILWRKKDGSFFEDF
jgi:hypothetical protein